MDGVDLLGDFKWFLDRLNEGSHFFATLGAISFLLPALINVGIILRIFSTEKKHMVLEGRDMKANCWVTALYPALLAVCIFESELLTLLPWESRDVGGFPTHNIMWSCFFTSAMESVLSLVFICVIYAESVEELDFWSQVNVGLSALNLLRLFFSKVLAAFLADKRPSSYTKMSETGSIGPPVALARGGTEGQKEWPARTKLAHLRLENALKNGTDLDTLKKLYDAATALAVDGVLLGQAQVTLDALRAAKRKSTEKADSAEALRRAMGGTDVDTLRQCYDAAMALNVDANLLGQAEVKLDALRAEKQRMRAAAGLRRAMGGTDVDTLRQCYDAAMALNVDANLLGQAEVKLDALRAEKQRMRAAAGLRRAMGGTDAGTLEAAITAAEPLGVDVQAAKAKLSVLRKPAPRVSPAKKEELNYLLGSTLVDSRMHAVQTIDLLKNNRSLVLYFGGQWCRHCVRFMPDVDRAYRILKEELGEAFEMVYVSGDKSPLDFRRYFEKMAWFALPYAPALRRSDLKRIFHVESIPTVVFLEWSGHKYTWSDIDGQEMFRSSEITIREYAGSIRWQRWG